MMDRALSSLFKVIEDEAGANAAFAARLEASLSRFAEDHVQKRRAEDRVGDFHPLIEYRKSPLADFLVRLDGFSQVELRLIIERHHLDPSGALKARASKKALTDFILTASKARAERDARLFEY
ncbi:MAG: hypothetical protein KGS00_08200 [Alphaproteobacteria bacterium]|nr:hypothetical protein [Alphaproteobacteria bacterium]